MGKSWLRAMIRHVVGTKTRRLLAATILAVGFSTVVTSLTAGAAATTTCGPYVYINGQYYQGYAKYCPIWTAPVPVYGGQAGPNHTVVGHLNYGDDSNWFICNRLAGWTYSYGGYSSPYWAYTVADNGQYGWVSGVYFAGTANYFVGLPECP
jgi:hypothetical protein